MSRRGAALRWTDEALAELRAKLERWAKDETERNGCFSITTATDALLEGNTNRDPVSWIVKQLEIEGLVKRHGRLGFRWLDVTPGKVRRKSRPYRWTPEALTSLETQVFSFATRRTREHGHFTRENAAEALEVPGNVLKPILRRLAENGRVERLGGSLGYRATGVEGPEVSAGRKGPAVWTPEAMTNLRKQVEQHAREMTMALGGFTISGATAELVGKRNSQPVATVVRAMEEEGLVGYLTKERRWVWFGLDRPAPEPAEPVVWTPGRLDLLRSDVSAYAQEQSARYGRFTIAGATESMGLGYKDPVSRVVHDLEREGRVVDLGVRLGWYWNGAMRQRVTLAELVALCVAHTPQLRGEAKPHRKQRRGRKGLDKERNVAELTKGELDLVRWAAGTIAEHAGEGTPASVDNVWFTWDPAADGGTGNWTILGHLRQWLRDATPNSRAKQVRGAEIMCDVAATHGLLERSTPSPLPAATAYAGELHTQVVHLEGRIMKEDAQANRATVRLGLKVLGRYLTRMQVHRWDHEALLTAREQITKDYRIWRDAEEDSADLRTGLPGHHHDAARYVWRRLPELQERKVWSLARDTRVGLFSNQAIARLVESVTANPATPKRWDFSGFVDDRGEYMRGFVESRFGLRRWVTWVTLEPSQLEHHGLPPRAWPRPNEGQEGKMRRARRRKEQLFRCRPTTLRSRLARISLIAGWMSRMGFNPRFHDFRFILDDERFAAYEEWRETHPTQSFYDPETEAARKTKGRDQLALDMSRIASPFCEAVALTRNFQDVADTMQTAAKALKIRGYERKPIENEVKIIREIYQAWSVGNRDGYLRLIDLVDLILEDAAGLEGRSLEEAVAALRDGCFAPSYTWALRIRDAVLIHCLRKIPLRARTLSLFEITEWRNHSVDGTPVSRLQKWEAAIQWIIDQSKMKTHRRDFSPAFIHEGDVGDPDAEDDAFRMLLEAYFRPGGARETLLTPCDNEAPVRSRYVFPAPIRYGKKQGENRRSGSFWRAPSVTAWFRRLIKRYAGRLGLDWHRLRKLHGATGVHVIRLLFGSYWVGQSRSEMASLFLGHTDPGFTIRLYSGRDESSGGMVLRAEARKRLPASSAVLEERDKLREELEQERAARQSAEDRSVLLAEKVSSLTEQVAELITVVHAKVGAAA